MSGSAAGMSEGLRLRRQLANLKGAWHRDKVSLVSAAFVLGLCVASILAPWLSPHDANQTNLPLRLSPPGTAGYWLGTDDQGRDILSRLLWGGRLSLIGGTLPVAISALIGYPLGLIAAYRGGLIGEVIMRTQDVFYAFPAVVLAIGISAALGPGLIHVTLALVVVIIPSIARVAHAATLSVMGNDYVEAARASGANDTQILIFHLVPNTYAPVLVYCTTLIGLVIVFASGLSFLGLGIQPPTAEWGAMIGELKDSTFVAPGVVLMPGLMILAVSIAFNLIGDGIRDALDPKLRIA